MGTRQIHPAMERMFAAARRRGLLGKDEATGMARLLNASPQAVNNWCTRGPSKQARLDLQRSTGISATWIETGEGPETIANGAASASAQPTPGVQELRTTPDRAKRLEQLMALAESLDDFGLVALIEKGKDLARDYPNRKYRAS